MSLVLQAVNFVDVRDEPGEIDILILVQAGDQYQIGPISHFNLIIDPINDNPPALDLSASETATPHRLGTAQYVEGSGPQTFSTDPSIADADLNLPFEVVLRSNYVHCTNCCCAD